MSYYRQPEFYRSFRCLGGECPSNCCALWTISWKPDEIQRLRSAECSPEMRSLINSSFIEDKHKEGLFKINLSGTNNMHCPFLDENGWCRIQKEIGEEYLSHVCRVYPRMNVIGSNIVLRTCCASCPGVMDILMKDENAMRLVSAPLESKSVQLSGKGDTAEQLEEHPELKYRSELLDFFFDIIGNKNRPLEVSLLLGALAAQKLTQFVEKGQADRIPEVIKALRPQLNCNSIPAFDNAVPDPQINPGLIAEMTDIFANTNLLNSLMDGDVLRLSRCAEGRRLVDEFLADKPNFMRNLALNLFLTGGMPLMLCDQSIFMNYSYFVATFCCARFIMAAAAFDRGEVDQQTITITCYHIRGMYHNPDRARIVMDTLKEHGCASPAFLAVLLK